MTGIDLRRHDQDEDGVYAERGRPVLVLRIDATLIEATSPKIQAAGH